jgi:hypothetical protein
MSFLAKQATSDECTFAKGGSLGTSQYVSPSIVLVEDVEGTRRWAFFFQYTIAPKSSSPVPPLTAWDLVSSTSGGTTAQVTLGATIASESVVVSNHFSTGKYSFALASTLSPGVPDQTTNRVTGLAWTIKDATNNVVAEKAAGSTVVDNKPGSTPYGGPPALLPTPPMPAPLARSRTH